MRQLLHSISLQVLLYLDSCTDFDAHLDIVCFTEKVSAKRIKDVHGALDEVTSYAPHIAEDKHSADEGVELGRLGGEVDGSLLCAQQRLHQHAQRLHTAYLHLKGAMPIRSGGHHMQYGSNSE